MFSRRPFTRTDRGQPAQSAEWTSLVTGGESGRPELKPTAPWSERSAEARVGGATRATRELAAAAHGDPWRPIIVDRPTGEFEPRPAPGAYVPDSIVDGWGSGSFVVRLASVRGYSHRYGGVPRQDDGAAQFHQASGSVVLAVADGVSDARLSHIGAHLVCTRLVERVCKDLDSPTGGLDWRLVMNEMAEVLEDRARRLTRVRGGGEAESLLATTVVAAVVTPTPNGSRASVARVGDSDGWILSRGLFRPVFAAKSSHSDAIINSAVAPLPRRPIALHVVSLDLEPDDVFLLGTDGFGDPLGDGTGLVGDLFFRELSPNMSPLRLAHLLDFSRETFDDDRTLAAVWWRKA